MKLAALIPAAGDGTRLGKGPKAFLPLDDQSLLTHAVAALQAYVDEIVVAISEGMQETILEHVRPQVKLVLGGKTRQETVYQLLQATDADIVLIHDAARPFLPAKVIHDSVEAVQRYGAATVTKAVADTLICKSTGDVVTRDELRAVQTPQSFLRELILEAHEKARANNIAATDDAALVRHLGHDVALVEGSSWLEKITTPDDYERARGLVRIWKEKSRKGEGGQGRRGD
jgi:2-C-methyl-D-erythritol 4-phosphate cytidylyltransferase